MARFLHDQPGLGQIEDQSLRELISPLVVRAFAEPEGLSDEFNQRWRGGKWLPKPRRKRARS